MRLWPKSLKQTTIVSINGRDTKPHHCQPATRQCILQMVHCSPPVNVSNPAHSQRSYDVSRQHSQRSYDVNRQHSARSYDVSRQHSERSYDVSRQHSERSYDVSRQHSERSHDVSRQHSSGLQVIRRGTIPSVKPCSKLPTHHHTNPRKVFTTSAFRFRESPDAFLPAYFWSS